MHDPLIVAHEVKYPWFKYSSWPKDKRRWESMTEAEQSKCCKHWKEGYRNTFITVWHKDPEKRGSDDSCGWSWPRVSEKQIEVLKNLAWHEGRNPYFLKCGGRAFTGTMVEAEHLERGLLLLVARVLKLKLSFEQASRMASEHINCPDCVHPGDKFCFEAGYHSNCKTDKPEYREDTFVGICCGAARHIMDLNRPWYRHPRWHIHHWRLQIHPWQQLKRGLFDRCCKCHKGFEFGESPITDWNGTRIWHQRCDNQIVSKEAQ